MDEHTWYQLQFLNVQRVYEDCQERSENIDEAISMLKHKRRLYGPNYRIIEHKHITRVLPEDELD